MVKVQLEHSQKLYKTARTSEQYIYKGNKDKIIHFFDCVLRKQNRFKETERKGKREQRELERSGENLCIKL